jgi:hypothetical protein
MTRKDSEKDAERPHYYSQFWLDVAAGRRVIGIPKPSDEVESSEAAVAEPVSSRKAELGPDDTGNRRASADGRAETIIHPIAEPAVLPEESIELEIEEFADELTVDELDEQDQQVVGETDIPDMDLDSDEEEGEEALEEEEGTEDLAWGRARKKARPTRQIRQPKKPRRDTRRSF